MSNTKKYYKENKKEIMARQRLYLDEIKEIDLELGRCVLCHLEKIPDNHERCRSCREYGSKNSAKCIARKKKRKKCSSK